MWRLEEARRSLVASTLPRLRERKHFSRAPLGLANQEHSSEIVASQPWRVQKLTREIGEEGRALPFLRTPALSAAFLLVEPLDIYRTGPPELQGEPVPARALVWRRGCILDQR